MGLFRWILRAFVVFPWGLDGLRGSLRGAPGGIFKRFGELLESFLETGIGKRNWNSTISEESETGTLESGNWSWEELKPSKLELERGNWGWEVGLEF